MVIFYLPALVAATLYVCLSSGQRQKWIELNWNASVSRRPWRAIFLCIKSPKWNFSFSIYAHKSVNFIHHVGTVKDSRVRPTYNTCIGFLRTSSFKILDFTCVLDTNIFHLYSDLLGFAELSFVLFECNYIVRYIIKNNMSCISIISLYRLQHRPMP